MTATRPLTEDEINATLLYRDALILVLNKPAGIAVHVTAHDKISLDQSFHHLQFGLPKKPELAHRLDRGTSGCLVLGRHRQALIKLGKLFEKQRVNKTYRAICVGVPAQPEGVIDRPILKSGVGSKWKMSLDEAGQAAVTEYRVLKTNGTLSEIEFSPKTGRTHQIRLHAAFAIGCPVVGDPFYGPQEGEFSATQLPMMLHAETVEIPLQQSKSPIIASAPLPQHMEKLLLTLT
jgi:tRNA pseudouridine32 synthase/23S rRNA pseudouridine746 synthase